MARTTMAALISRTRLLIGDPAGASQTFTDDDIEGTLDRCRIDVRYLDLNAQVTLAQNTPTLYTDYYSSLGDWEDSPTLTSYQWLTIDPSLYTEDAVTGHWHFDAGQLPDVRLTGASYDLYLAAGQLTEAWAALLARDFDFKSGDDEYKRSQKIAGLMASAKAHRGRARLVEMRLHGSDHTSLVRSLTRRGGW